MHNKRPKRRYHTSDRRTGNSIAKPIFYLMLEFILFGMILKLIYTIDILIFNEVIALIMMGAFGLWSLNYIRTSSLPRLKKVLRRQQDNYTKRRNITDI